ncbi:MAG: gamma-glutamyltransferase family protein [Ectothiorhodospiraceae bacterium]|nr:gamma-glutamyltransferase family protein [Chromatiales bacterium]MCP5153814.1 gamma-glutamyltransferase family protein [Ectothiorhodospiraceae bacterium]
MSLVNYPYPSRRSALLAANGVVATSQPLAAQAGLAVLQRGGNAVDAAIATAAALTVLEPTSNGIGSDAFALVWDGKKLHGLNASGRSPAATDPERLRAGGAKAMPQRGWGSVTVPGAPAAWGDLQARFGRLELATLLEPAITYARDGFPVSPVISRLWARATPQFHAIAEAGVAPWRDVFTPSGRPPEAGERWSSRGHAACLTALAERGVRDFYEGSVAEGIAAFAARSGGILTLDDLAAHANEWVEPIGVDYRGHTVWEIPPNGQGIAALMALGMVEHTDMASHPHGSNEAWHRQIEAMKLAFADAYRYVADQEHAEVPVAGMLSRDYLAARAASIGDRAADPGPGEPPRGGTVYLCTADRDGMMVSFIQSNYMGFGSGVVVPELGVSFQNRGAGFVLDPDHPNVVAPRKRPRHTIIPGFLTRGDEAIGPFGVMGGEMQPPGHLQVMTSMLDWDLNPQSALDAPRWYFAGGKAIHLEPGTPAARADALRALGHEVTVAPDDLSFGRGQIIVRLDNGVYAAGSEPRTDGAAVGW